MNPTDDDRRTALIELGAEALADVILELALLTDEADQTVERIISDDSANLARLEERIANCVYDEDADIAGPVVFTQRLDFLLHDLSLSVHDGFEGFRLTSLFIENDFHVFNNVRDDGTFSHIFQNAAVELLVHYGSVCNDKEWLCHQLFRLYDEDEIGSRWNIFAGAAEYIPEEKVRALIERMQSAVKSNPGHEAKWLHAVEALAMQIKDFDLFEQARLAGSSTLSTADICEIARMRLDADDASGALKLLKKVDATRNRQTEFNRLLLAVYKALDMKEEEAAQAWKLFKSVRDEENFEALLQAIGESEREAVIDGEMTEIFATHGVTYSDAHFLLNGKRFDDAEKYLWQHVVPLKRGLYANILPLAQAMEANDRYLMASFLYRVVLDELLQQGYSKSYHHGVNYLRKLDAMSEKIEDWKELVPHAEYVSQLRKAHVRKGSFWSQYGGILG
jgi:hypothetical protein